ncbi:putative ABC transport system permease protein [Flavobacterium cutihirudinis]|uniref:Putative ABC transport system permease protein n=1 Tax=Flavobacterium cutihirudinis TaxID=1265740 RepID=A0A3D9FKP3_9FLAO|nr:ABC transporter permease [Flavobacterium cutihirudinis]RED19730.1 putative ABC transport system permease protein [Flavobacterium cutihirudinis]
MLKNWINTFFYHIKNNKLFSILNILGLSIGMATLIFAILFWNDEHSYNQWNPEKDKIYSVLNDIGEGNIWTTNAATTGPMLKAISSDLDSYCYFYAEYAKDVISYNGKKEVLNKIFTAQSNFFSFFPYKFIHGNGKTAIQDRSSIALSEETAERLFGTENPMGKLVRYDGQVFTVRGVYQLSEKSSVMPEAVTTVIDDDLKRTKDEWSYHYGLVLKIKNPNATAAIIKNMDNLFFENVTKAQAKSEGLSIEEFTKKYGNPVKTSLLPMPEAKLYNGNQPFSEPTGNLQYLLILMGLSILILLLSIVNYINLATANAIKRAKEIGVRKITGATKGQIIMQFVFETALITIFSALLALVLVEILLPYYNSFLNKDLVLVGAQFFIQLIIITLLVILVSGVLPAIYVSNFEVLKVLKGNFSRSKKGIWLRNGMLVLQFAIAAFFIIGSFIVYKQVNFMAEKDLGFKGTQVLDITFKPKKEKSQFERYKLIKQEASKIKGVEAVSTALFAMGSQENSWSSASYQNRKPFLIQEMAMDLDMLDMLDIKLLKGRKLNPAISSDTISSVLINEETAKLIGEKDVLNKTILWRDQKLKIVGVVKNFNYFGLESRIGPMVLFYVTKIDGVQDDIRHVFIKVKPDDIPETIARINKFWTQKVDSEYPFEYNFVDKNYARNFKKYENQRNLFALLNIIVILIAVFGLFALASFSMERRLREIAIRKTLGAETNVLLKDLSKQYVVFCVIGFLIGILPAYLLLQKWLENFAFRIDIPVLPFLIAFVSLLFLTLTIVLAKAYQVTKVEVLRYLKYE